MRKSAQMYTVREFTKDKAGMANTLKKIKAIGYDSIQTGTPSYLTNVEFKAMLDEAGLTDCSAGGNYGLMVSDPKAGIGAAIEQAHVFGVNYVEVGTLPQEWRESEEGYKLYAASLNKIAAELKKEGMRLLYHPHALEFYSFGNGKKGFDILFDETDPEGVNFTLDTHWMTAGGVNVAKYIRKVKGRMTICHFKDYAIVGGAEDHIERVCKQFAEVGEGNIDWPSVIEACKEIGVEYAVVEQDICKGDPFDSLAVSYNNMIKFDV